MASRALIPEYPIETGRLLLRPVDPSRDVDAFHAYQSLPEVCRYIPYEPRTREDIAARFADPEKNRSMLAEPGQALQLAVEIRETGVVAGDVMLFWQDETNAEIGYVVHPGYQGRGIATEASAALLDLAFGTGNAGNAGSDPHGLGVHRVVARVDERNKASAAVLVKLGMRREAVLVENEWFKGEWSTEVGFAILDREWRAAAYDERHSTAARTPAIASGAAPSPSAARQATYPSGRTSTAPPGPMP